MTTTLETPGLLTFTISIVVFFGGAGLNRCIAPLHRWNITDAVTGGLLASLVTLVTYRIFGLEITFDLDVRDMLLLYFFTGIGLNARLSDLFRCGRSFFYSAGVVRRAADEVLLAAEPAARFSRTIY
jgi:ESS family glutamate:Na+ symporter